MASRPQDLIFQLTSNAQPIFNDIITEINQALISEYITYDELQRCLLYLLIPETTWIKTLTLTPLIQPIQTQTTPINQFTSKDLQSLQYNLGIFLSIDQHCIIINGKKLSQSLFVPNVSSLHIPLAKSDLAILPKHYAKPMISSTWLKLYDLEPIHDLIYRSCKSIRALPPIFKQTILTFINQPFNSLTSIFTYIQQLPISSFSLNPIKPGVLRFADYTTPDPYTHINQQTRSIVCTISQLPQFDIPFGTKSQREDDQPHDWIYWVQDTSCFDFDPTQCNDLDQHWFEDDLDYGWK
jgi:hypothetical protein